MCFKGRIMNFDYCKSYFLKLINFFLKVHEEFINNMTNTTVESLIQKFAESKGTGKERPGKKLKLTE